MKNSWVCVLFAVIFMVVSFFADGPMAVGYGFLVQISLLCSFICAAIEDNKP